MCVPFLVARVLVSNWTAFSCLFACHLFADTNQNIIDGLHCNCNEFRMTNKPDNKRSTNTNQQSSKTKLGDWLAALFCSLIANRNRYVYCASELTRKEFFFELKSHWKIYQLFLPLHVCGILHTFGRISHTTIPHRTFCGCGKVPGVLFHFFASDIDSLIEWIHTDEIISIAFHIYSNSSCRIQFRFSC